MCRTLLCLSAVLTLACSTPSPDPAAAKAAIKADALAKDGAMSASRAPVKPNEANPAQPSAQPSAQPVAHPDLPAGHPPVGEAAGSADKQVVKPSGTVRSETIGGLTLAVPVEWTRGQPSSSMRLAEFSVPGPGGAGSLAVFRFPGGAGTIDANIERWVGQFKGEGGNKPVPLIAKRDVGKLHVTSVDVSGGFAGSSMPGAPTQAAIESARMFGLIVEGDGDPYFLKLVGAKTTLDLWAPSWEALAGSAAVTGPKAADAAADADHATDGAAVKHGTAPAVKK